MIHNLITGGGAGLSLTLADGAQQPSAPKENTLWVNTDVKAAGWVFSAGRPETPAEGMVWIATGVASTAPLNVAPKETVMLYPLSAQQYTGGAWVSLNAAVYTLGAWVDLWNGYLFDFGDQHEAVTGGWITQTDANASASVDGTITLSGADYKWAYAATAQKVSLDGYSKLAVKIISPGGAYTGHGVRLSNGPLGNVDAAASFSVSYQSGKNVYSWDISALTGAYYVVLQCGNNAGISHQQIWLER